MKYLLKVAIYRTRQQISMKIRQQTKNTVSTYFSICTSDCSKRKCISKCNRWPYNNSCRGLQEKKCYICQVFFSTFCLY